MSSLVSVLVIVAVVGYLMARRLTGGPLTGRRLVGLPAILAGLGAYQLVQHPLTLLDVGLLVAEAAVAVGLGLARGATIRLYEKAGQLWFRYSVATVALWLGSAAIRVLLGLGGRALGATTNASATMMLLLGATFLGESAVVAARARRSGVPYAQDRRGARAWSADGGINQEPR